MFQYQTHLLTIIRSLLFPNQKYLFTVWLIHLLALWTHVTISVKRLSSLNKHSLCRCHSTFSLMKSLHGTMCCGALPNAPIVPIVDCSPRQSIGTSQLKFRAFPKCCILIFHSSAWWLHFVLFSIFFFLIGGVFQTLLLALPSHPWFTNSIYRRAKSVWSVMPNQSSCRCFFVVFSTTFTTSPAHATLCQ